MTALAEQIAQLEAMIAAQDALRPALGDAAVDAMTAPIRAQIDALRQAQGTALRQAQPMQATRAGPGGALPATFGGGRYEVKSFLGEGGRKQVYLAHDTRLGRDVAFALIKVQHLDEMNRRRIAREVQAMGRLGSHPQIVTVFDSGDEPFGGVARPYIVSELMAGGDVCDLIAAAPNHQLPIPRALEIVRQVCRGLAYAHARQIVHRDLKPGNVWLAAGGAAKIGDFGLAIPLDESRLTESGMMVGTILYMPPEQAMGGAITPRSDLYALGCMLYEMVTGKPPFTGDDQVAIIGQHLNTPPVAPAWHRPDCPAALDALILRLMEKEPAKRPDSAEAVERALEEIEAVLQDTGVQLNARAAGALAADTPIYRRAFVGREAELKQAHAAFDAALSGRGSLLMIAGEPGIGKTALAEQLATYVALRGGRALVGHCYEEGSLSLPYMPFVEAIRSYALSRDSDTLQRELGGGAGDVARIVSEIRDRIAAPLPAASDPEDNRYRLLQAVATFLQNAGTAQPLLLVLEDLHWADRGTLDMLLHLARNLAGARLLVVGTYRDVEVERTHPLSAALSELRRQSGFVRLALRGLTADEVQRMLNAIAGQPTPWSLAEAVHRQTEGNPLFIQEVLRYLVEEGLVAREEGRWRAQGQTPLAMAIPEGLRDVIGKRLSRLSADCNRLLAIAAVIGREFALETLTAVASIGEDELLKGLEEAVRVGVLEETAYLGRVRYRFTHAFFRQTLYEELIAPRRIRLHQQIARVLETQHAARLSEHAAELAEHFAQSADPADLKKAVHYGELAAQRAASVFAHGEAARLWEQALQIQEVLDPEDTPKRCDLLLALCEALVPAGDPKRVVEETADAALRLAESLNDPARCARACASALLAMWTFGALWGLNMPAGRRWVNLAQRYATNDLRQRVLITVNLAQIRTLDERHSEAYALRLRALEEARAAADPEATALAASMAMLLSAFPGNQDKVLQLALEMAELPRDHLSTFTAGQLLFALRSAFFLSGLRDRADQARQDFDAIARKVNEPFLILRGMLLGAMDVLADGDLVGALEQAQAIVARADELGSPVFGVSAAAGIHYTACCHLGRYGSALDLFNAGLRMTRITTPTPYVRTREAVILAHLRPPAGENAGLDFLSELTASALADPATGTSSLTMILEAATVAGDRERAQAIATRLLPAAPYLGMALSLVVCPARVLSDAFAFLGDPAQALACARQALDLATRTRYRPEVALAHLHIAELLWHSADAAERAEAREHLAIALPELRAMQMAPGLARAEALQ